MSLSAHEQNQLVTDHLDLVGRIVAELSARYPRHVDRSELWNAGALGLVEASRRFDPGSGFPFSRYAAIRIRGAIIDSTRTRDWATRSVRRNLRELREAEAGLESSDGKVASPGEFASFLGISEQEVDRRRAEAVTSTLLHLDQSSDSDESPLVDRVEESRSESLPEMAIEQREIRGTLVEAVRNLPPVQAGVIARYYLEGELQQGIAQDLGLTEARVSQIRSEALMAMRGYFSTQYEGVPAADDEAPGRRARAAYLERMAERSNLRSRLDAERLLDPAIRGEISLIDHG